MPFSFLNWCRYIFEPPAPVIWSTDIRDISSGTHLTERIFRRPQSFGYMGMPFFHTSMMSFICMTSESRSWHLIHALFLKIVERLIATGMQARVETLIPKQLVVRTFFQNPTFL